MENNEQNVQNNEVTEVSQSANETVNEKVVSVNEVNDSVIGNYKKKSKTGLIIGIIAVLAVIGMGAFFAYKMLFASPKSIFLKAINKSYSNIEDILDESSSSNTDIFMSKDKTIKVSYDFNLDLDLNEEIEKEIEDVIKLINSLNAGVSVAIDQKNSQMDLLINLSDSTDKIEAGLYLRDNKVYMELKDLYEKYILLDTEDVDLDSINSLETSIPQVEVKDVEYLLATVKDAVLKSLNDKNFKSSSKEIEINGKKVKTKEISYTIDQKELKSVISSTLKELKSNSKFIELVSKYSETEKDEINSALDELIKKVNDLEINPDNNTKIIINTYVTGLNNNSIGFSMSVDAEQKVGFEYYNYDKVQLFNVLVSDSKMLTFENKEVKKNEYETTVVALTAKLKLQTKLSENGSETTYSFTEASSGIDISGKVEANSKEVEKDKKYEGSTLVSATIKVAEENLGTIKATAKYEADLDAKLKEIDEDKAVTVEALEKDQDKIMTNLSKNGLFNKIGELIGSSSIGNNIASSKKSAAEDTAYGLIKAAEYKYALSLIDDDVIFEKEIKCNGISCGNLEFVGNVPTSGKIITSDDGDVTIENLVIDGYTCNLDEDGIFVTCE